MKSPETLWLSRHDVDAAAIGPSDCIDLVRKAMEWQADGSLEVPAKIGIHPPKGRHINAMPAFIAPLAAAGLKWVADFPENRSRGLATIHGLIVLNDPETGVPFCIMEGALVTAKRTAAMTGLSFRACALPSVTVGTIVGTGAEANSHVITLPKALPTLQTLRVVGRDLAAAERFCQELTSAVTVELIPFVDRELAVRDAQVIVTVTNATSTRLLEPAWIAAGATVAILDNAGKETTLLHALDRIIVDDRRPFATEEVQRRFASGLPCIDGEVGEILRGRIEGRRNAQERIMILNLGSAACDVVVATEIYQRAIKLGLGVEIEL
jgi:ornithine cyclodeaminase/alanine dehydrogenase-like protein (mu-crystallin family)